MENQYQFLDLHCDTISRIRWLRRKGEKTGLRTNALHIDLERMRQAGYLLQTFAAFVRLPDPETKETRQNPLEDCLELIDLFYQEMEANADWIAPVRSVREIEQNAAAGRLSALLSIEEGGVCRGELCNLRNFYRLGVRMMTLTWNFENELAYPNEVSRGSLGKPRTEHGLKQKGVEFLQEMERLGMLIDVSHLSDAGFYEVAEHTKKPFIASHSNARAVCGHVRNLTDDMLRLLAERGGVTGMNLCAEFTQLPKEGELPFGTIAGVVHQICHIREVAGVDCLALGTDYDGIGNELELSDCSKLPLLAEALKKAGFTENELEKLFYRNALRVMKEVWK